MHCRNCGSEVNAKAIACPKCGVPPFSEKKFCQECGEPTNEKQIICLKCGVKLTSKGSGGLGDFNIDTSSITNTIGSTLSSSNLSFIDSDKMKIISIISSIAMVILIFLPWYSGGFRSSHGDASSSLSAIQTISVSGSGYAMEAHKTVSVIGIILLLCSLGAVASNFKKFKWAIIFGGINFLLALLWIFSMPSGRMSMGGSEASAGVAWGAYLFFLFSIAFIISNIKTFKES